MIALLALLTVGVAGLRVHHLESTNSLDEESFNTYIKRINIQIQISDYYIRQTDYHNSEGFLIKNGEVKVELNSLE